MAWLERYDGNGNWPVSFHQHAVEFKLARRGETPELRRDNFHTVCAIGHVVLMLFVADVPEGPVVRGASGSIRTLIWPLTGRDVAWPPQESFPDDSVLEEESRRTPDGIVPPFSRQ